MANAKADEEVDLDEDETPAPVLQSKNKSNKSLSQTTPASMKISLPKGKELDDSALGTDDYQEDEEDA